MSFLESISNSLCHVDTVCSTCLDPDSGCVAAMWEVKPESSYHHFGPPGKVIVLGPRAKKECCPPPPTGIKNKWLKILKIMYYLCYCHYTNFNKIVVKACCTAATIINNHEKQRIEILFTPFIVLLMIFTLHKNYTQKHIFTYVF